MVLTLIWQFHSFIRPALILAVIPLTVTGFGLTLALAPGANFGFMAILGVLALAGIVVNNAIILIDRIDVERANAGTPSPRRSSKQASRRLRPIVMTTCTTALGLAPIIIARDVLFYELALVIAGGLADRHNADADRHSLPVRDRIRRWGEQAQGSAGRSA